MAEIGKKKLTDAEKVLLYEQNGAAKLYYALNRKMNEMADLFNENSMCDVSLDDVKDKSFDRLFKLLEKSEIVGKAAQGIRDFAGISGDEAKDVERKPFVDTIAQSRA